MSSVVRVFLLLLLTASLAACGGDEGASGEGGDDRAAGTAVAAVEIQPRDLSRQLAVSGNVQPRVLIRLASRAEGTVKSLHADVGYTVAQDELLAELDVSEGRAELQRARAQAREARVAYERSQYLRERGMVSAADFDAAEAHLQVARSEEVLWRTRVGFGEIRAPRAATVTRRYKDVGEAVDERETVFELSAMETLIVPLGVSELDVAHMQFDQVVPLRLDALPDEIVEGRIARIEPSAEADSRLVRVEVSLPEDAYPRGVRPGYLARVRMPIDERADVLAVPAAALGERDDERYVYVIKDDELHRRIVEIGATRGDWTEIRDGLEVGEVVLATNPIDMQDGQTVRIVGYRG